MIKWQERQVKLTELRPFEKNPRRITSQQYEKLKKSIEENGYHQRIIATQDLRVIGGHQRIKVLQELGMDVITVLVPDQEISDRQFTRLLVQDNLPFGQFDWEAAGPWQVDDLKEWGVPDEWMPKQKPIEGLTDPDSILLPAEEPASILGDIWQLGDHRLMCGDSTKADDVAKLMGGQKADICFTSPPYGIADSAKLRDHYIRGNKKRQSLYQTHDDNADEWLSLMNGWFSEIRPYCEAVLCNVQMLAANKCSFIEWIYANRNDLVDIVIWDKIHGAPQMQKGILTNSFEFIAIFGGNASRTIPFADWHGNIENIIRIDPRGKNENADTHRAVMPVGLPQWVLDELCPKSESVIDPFSGSGTTIIAAEMTGRKCLAMEISPAYVSLACERWMAFTGKEAILDRTGDTYSQVKERLAISA